MWMTKSRAHSRSVESFAGGVARVRMRKPTLKRVVAITSRTRVRNHQMVGSGAGSSMSRRKISRSWLSARPTDRRDSRAWVISWAAVSACRPA